MICAADRNGIRQAWTQGWRGVLDKGGWQARCHSDGKLALLSLRPSLIPRSDPHIGQLLV